MDLQTLNVDNCPQSRYQQKILNTILKRLHLLKKLHFLFSSKMKRSSQIKGAELEIFRNVKVHIKVNEVK
jgi:hypothetical protein